MYVIVKYGVDSQALSEEVGGGFEDSINDEVGGGTKYLQVVFSPEEEEAAKGPRVLRVPEEEVVTSVGLQIRERISRVSRVFGLRGW